jgi:hypothetical protein
VSLVLGLQGLLGISVLALVVHRARVLLFEAPIDTKPFLGALVSAVETGDRAKAQRLLAGAQPSWVAQMAECVLGERADLEEEELISDFRFEAFKGLRALRTLASMGTATGFLGAIVQIIWLYHGDLGLLALQAGLPEKIALERALAAMAAGVAIAIVAFSSLAVLKRAAMQLVKDAERAQTALAAASTSPSASPPKSP